MAETFSAQLSILIAGSTFSAQLGSLNLSGSSVLQKSLKALASGDNTITRPTGANWCLINFNAANSSTYKLKGAGGDTGITLNAVVNKFLFIPVSADFIINSSGLDTYNTEFIWF